MYQKTLLPILFCLFLKSLKAFSISLNQHSPICSQIFISFGESDQYALLRQDVHFEHVRCFPWILKQALSINKKIQKVIFSCIFTKSLLCVNQKINAVINLNIYLKVFVQPITLHHGPQCLKVVSATFLLACFSNLKESTCEARENVFHFTLKALFVLEKISF